MTRDEILSMKPGRELDALVAEYVVGMKEHRKAYPESFDERVIWFRNPPNVTAYYVPFYSTDISAAWEVVGKLQNDYVLDFKLERKYCVAAMKFVAVFEDLDGKKWVAHGWIAPEAICKAAMLAVMGE